MKIIKELAKNKILTSILVSCLILLGVAFFSSISDIKPIYGAAPLQGCTLPDGTSGQTGAPCCTNSQCLNGGTCTGQNGNNPGACQGGGVTPGAGDTGGVGGSEVNPGSPATIVCDLFGSAWSSNIGWVKMNNCTAPNSGCTGQTFSVGLWSDDSVIGHAWSSSIGWIKFGGLIEQQMPTGNGTNQQNARLSGGQGNNQQLKGWIRAIIAPITGAWGGNNPDTDWDGWISLGGSSPNYQVNYNKTSSNSGVFSGFAWGGQVLGWLNFDNIVCGNPAVFAYHLENDGPVTVVSGGDPAYLTITRVLDTAPTQEVLISIASETIPGVTLDIQQDTPDENPCAPNCANKIKIEASGSGGALQNKNGFLAKAFGLKKAQAQSSEQATYTVVVKGTSANTPDQYTSFQLTVSGTPSPVAVTCSAVGAPYYVNKPVTWIATPNPLGLPYTYSWSGTGGLSGNTQEITKTYTTTGVKTATVTIMDTESGAQATCYPAGQINVGVKPLFEQF